MSESMAYIGRLQCGCVVAFVTDEKRFLKQVAEDVAEMIRNGYSVEHVTDQYMRENIVKPCPHKRERKDSQY